MSIGKETGKGNSKEIEVQEELASGYDDLFERARTQWQFGDWDSLVDIDSADFKGHPQRARLALLAAAGYQQKGDIASTRRLVRNALNWGAERRLVAQVLTAGVHNTLGRAFGLGGEHGRSLEQFRSSIRTGTPGAEARLLTAARVATQFHQLELSGEKRFFQIAEGEQRPEEAIGLVDIGNEEESISGTKEIEPEQTSYINSPRYFLDAGKDLSTSIHLADMAMVRGDIKDAVNRFLHIIDIEGDSTPKYVYKRLEEARARNKELVIQSDGEQNTSFNRSLKKFYDEHQGKVSDKWSSYLHEYVRIFQEYRKKKIRLLEIGVQNGGSLEIWAKYFKNARKIIGCDIYPKCAELTFDDDRIDVVIGDANTDFGENAIVNKADTFDIVIDDGSHFSSDVIKSFARYFPRLNYNGIYVIEDLHCSYWEEYEGGISAPFSSMTFLKLLADVINFEHWRVDEGKSDYLYKILARLGINISDEVLDEVHSIKFVNSLCIIEKAEKKFNDLGIRNVTGIESDIVPNIKQLLGSTFK
jgi:hypothetical protein